ncbi:hypothetical protein [Sphingorhabdus sp. 109]|jgi:hypothetical protein|uniref:hypothetical protein n=1 Tax=Sphingorhabdus sp. 109 TaxID=2653173 RepID=UPI00135C35ED|nr:hypothetical protein [Sphingorhabdus sp. 109]
MSSDSDRRPAQAVEADPLLTTTAGAPLRAMVTLAAIWIVVRVISWHGTANIVSNPPQPVSTSAAYRAGDSNRLSFSNRSLAVPIEIRREQANTSDHHSSNMTGEGALKVPVEDRKTAHVPDRPSWRWQDSEEASSFLLQTLSNSTGSTAPAGAGARQPFPVSPALHARNRFSAYFWIFARQDPGPDRGVQGNGRQLISNGQYGGSQAGAILSYQLLDRRAPDISLYGRVSTALDPWSQEEVALGARIQPVRTFPVALHAEQRFDAARGRESGTAFFVTGGTGPEPIAERWTLETYAQAGYVLGPNETYFFDGAATVQRPIAGLGSARISVGPGAWAGGQRNIRRVDVGPRIDVAVPVIGHSARIALDWRIRVAGNARPGNGAALTVSTGF